MAKNLKLTIKNTQIAEGINLSSLKDKLAKKKQESETSAEITEAQEASKAQAKEDTPRAKARSKSVFSEDSLEETKKPTIEPVQEEKAVEKTLVKKILPKKETEKAKEINEKQVISSKIEKQKPTTFVKQAHTPEKKIEKSIRPVEKNLKPTQSDTEMAEKSPPPVKVKARPASIMPVRNIREEHAARQAANIKPFIPQERGDSTVKLGPTGRHMRDLVPPPKPPVPKQEPVQKGTQAERTSRTESVSSEADKAKPKFSQETTENKTSAKSSLKTKEFRDVKPSRKADNNKTFDARDRQGLRSEDERNEWRKKRQKGHRAVQEDTTIRPTALKVRVPISIKDLAAQMKLKSSQLIAKLFLQGSVMTLNDLLDDEVVLHMLGSEFGCELTIDSSEEERIRITDKTVKEEIAATNEEELEIRPPVVAFMGHVDHGKTSLIDFIRKSNRAAGEAGAITQHIGAFRCTTSVGAITVLDTPGHEAFSAMRARGADVTDIVVLVVAGDEGIRQQTVEAIQHAKAAGVTIVVAINKSDKPNFNAENVYRQLSENNLLSESWGGNIITVNCSAVTGEGIQQLLEMLALQAEILELRANSKTRARGTVLESELHKGMGSVATVLVQNGTLKIGDSVVFNQFFGRIKTIQDEHGNQLQIAPPSAPVAITGLSGLPEAGQEFIVVKNEKEAREISEARILDKRESNLLLKKKVSMENLLQQSSEASKKVLNIVLRADVQGSLEALKVALQKIQSEKADLNIIFTGVGEISESDVQLAAASKAAIIGFHTHIESHADVLAKELGIQARLHDIIYHAIDDVKALMAGLLDKIAIETDKGQAEVRATFKSSHHGVIAGCYVTDGTIHRNHSIRVMRNKELVHKGSILSLKRIKEDVREVAKGLECGIILNNFELQEGDMLDAYEISYISQNL